MKPTNLETAGEFPTPKIWADKAHEYIEKSLGKTWKEDHVVWDCCCGESNLTKDYKFKELYCSTLNHKDLDSVYNCEKFQYDFLNDGIKRI